MARNLFLYFKIMSVKFLMFLTINGLALLALENQGEAIPDERYEDSRSWTNGLTDIWNQVKKDAKDTVNGLKKITSIAVKSVKKEELKISTNLKIAQELAVNSLRYTSLFMKIEKDIYSGNVNGAKSDIKDSFNELSLEDQEKVTNTLNHLAEKEQTEHYLTSFLASFAEYLEKRQIDAIEEPFAHWFAREMGKHVDKELETEGYQQGYGQTVIEEAMKYIPDYMTKVDILFKEIPLNQQKRMIESMKKISEQDEYEIAVTKLFKWIAKFFEEARRQNNKT